MVLSYGYNDSIQHVTPEAVKRGVLFPANSIIMATTATIGEHALITVDSLANQRFTFLSKKVNRSIELDMKFMFYYGYILGEWCKKNTNTASFPSVNMKKFKKFSIPVPPLEVQHAIVEILDRYSELVYKLEIELNAQIIARRKQYEYCRNELLNFSSESSKIRDSLGIVSNEKVEFKALGEICEVKSGEYVSKTRILKNPGTFPVINSGKSPLGYIDEFNEFDNPLGITSRGAGVGSITWCEGKYFRGSLNYSAAEKNRKMINKRFLFHLLSNDHGKIKKLSTFQGIPALNSSNLKKLSVPVPPLEVQNAIVEILDRYSELVYKLEIELKDEIISRRQQYEYCRNLLLSFPERERMES